MAALLPISARINLARNWASLTAVLFKLSGVLLKLLKSAKAIKVGLGAASLAAYAWMFTPQFAVILIAALVLHEYGHLRAMKTCGIPTKGIFLIPFFGGAAVAEKAFASRADESYVAMMGPVWGLGTAVIPGLLYLAYPHPLLAGVASFIALMNLFNLLPVNPLDGGRVVKSLAFSFGSWYGLAVMFLGLFAIFFGMIFMNIGLFLLIGFIALVEILSEWSKLHREIPLAQKEIRDAELWVKMTGSLPPGVTKEMISKGKELLKEWTKPGMSSKQIGVHSMAYVLLIASFVSVIYVAAKVPGADVALKAITEHHE